SYGRPNLHSDSIDALQRIYSFAQLVYLVLQTADFLTRKSLFSSECSFSRRASSALRILCKSRISSSRTSLLRPKHRLLLPNPYFTTMLTSLPVNIFFTIS